MTPEVTGIGVMMVLGAGYFYLWLFKSPVPRQVTRHEIAIATVIILYILFDIHRILTVSLTPDCPYECLP